MYLLDCHVQVSAWEFTIRPHHDDGKLGARFEATHGE